MGLTQRQKRERKAKWVPTIFSFVSAIKKWSGHDRTYSDDFIEKLGERLDIRGNSELCTSHQPNKENLSSYLEIPACLSSKPRNGKSLADESPEDPAEMRPTQYNSSISSSLSSSL